MTLSQHSCEHSRESERRYHDAIRHASSVIELRSVNLARSASVREEVRKEALDAVPEADGAIDEGGRAIGYRTPGRVIEEMNKCGFAARSRVTGSRVRALEGGSDSGLDSEPKR